MNDGNALIVERVPRRSHFFFAIAFLTAFFPSPGPAHAVVMTTDQRAVLADFAARLGRDALALENRHAATGMIQCGATYSTAQLTLANHIITTAAHAFINPQGQARSPDAPCLFHVVAGGQTLAVPVDPASVVLGARDPYAVHGVHDWAVARLVAPVAHVVPYAISAAPFSPGAITMVAHRHTGWVHDGKRAAETCAIHTLQEIDPGAPREIDIDCSAGSGASGSAILSGPVTDGDVPVMVAIYVGWRSDAPHAVAPFSARHYNYGITVDGDFRAALTAMAGVQSAAQSTQPVAYSGR